MESEAAPASGGTRLDGLEAQLGMALNMGGAMARRTVLGLGASALAVVGIAGVHRGLLKRRLDLPRLPAATAELYDEKFVGALPSWSLQEVADALRTRGVLVGSALAVDEVAGRAASDPLIEYDCSLYTETELLLYALVARNRAAGDSG